MLRIAFATAILLAIGGSAHANEYVRGHYRSNGTYVAPYHRSSRDDTYNNNWSRYPNVNPYTGRQGSLPQTWNDRSPSPYQHHGLYGAPTRSRTSFGYGLGR
jgi:hypothetical protein